MNERGFDADALTRHTGWIRALALELVRDPHVAEDLVQDTLLVALERPPRATAALGRWLPRVLSTLVRERRRTEAQRRAREERAARRGEDALEAGRELDVSGDIVRAVQALDEPYRTTVVLRHFQGLAPRRIAARQGVPVKTVNTRLNRAHAELRRRLDGEYGERRAWVLAAAPLVALARREVRSAGTRLGLGTAAIAGAAAVAVLALRDDAERTAGTTAPSGRELAAERSDPRLARPAPAVGGAPREVPGELAAAAEPPAAVAVPVTGRVVDPAGTPVGGVVVELLRTRTITPDEREFFGGNPLAVRAVGGPVATAESGPDGGFRFGALPPDFDGQTGYLLGARADAWAAAVRGFVRTAAREEEQVVVVAPRVDLAGIVTDERGAPLPGARVAFEGPASVYERVPARVAGAMLPRLRAETDADGRFRLERVPCLAGGAVVARAEGRRDERRALPSPCARELELSLTLEPLEPLELGLAGLVLDEDGTPVEGATVTLGRDVARTGGDGRFHLPLAGVESAHVLTAAAPGRLPGELAVEAPPPGEPAVWPDDVVLFLEGRPAAIEGRVVDLHTGEPLPGADLWPIDPTPFATGATPGGLAHPPLVVESFLAQRDEDAAFSLQISTDADGRFRLDGLLPRAYRLSCVDRETLSRAETGPVAAGATDVVVRCDRSAAGLVRGRVVHPGGEPLAGLLVRPGTTGVLIEPGETWFETVVLAPPATTGADGWFAFERLSPHDLQLVVTGSEVIGRVFRIPAGIPHDRIELTISRRCLLRIELVGVAGPDAPDVFRVRDEQGNDVQMQRLRASALVDFDWAPIQDGSSEVTAIPESARTLVLLRGEREVARLPLEPRPGETLHVRWP